MLVPSAVQEPRFPEAGVPKAGVTRVGLVAKTSAPLPVSSVTAVARFAELGVARNVAMPVPSPLTPVLMGRPVQLVSVPLAGVPSVGLISVGDVENTRLDEVVPVEPAAVNPEMLLNAAIPALVAFVPPSATVTGAVSEKAVPVSVNPVEAVYDPAPLNCDQYNEVVPSVPPALAVQTNPQSALTVPCSINVNADVSSSHVSASLVRVHAPAAQR